MSTPDRSLVRTGDLYSAAMAAQEVGINVIPVRADGSKSPALAGWQAYQKRRVTHAELKQWFRRSDRGIAVVTGHISGNLEALDIDSPETYRAWLKHIQSNASLSSIFERIARGYLEATPDGGRHLLYRCEAVGHNQKLARKPLTEMRGYQTLIETRGTGGLLIVAPSRGLVHPSGRPYTLLHGGFAHMATITQEERLSLLDFAHEFDEVPVQLREERAEYHLFTPRDPSMPRPGDLFNQRTAWEKILIPHGWVLVRMINGQGQWRRPGKKSPGISATTNYAGNDLLYVFSTSTLFEPERGYTKFTAYTILEHDGDFSAAARALLQEE